MGQCYKIILKKPNGVLKSYEPIDGLKLMEFSLCPSDTVACICKELEEPKRLFIVGDYASDSDNRNTYSDNFPTVDELRNVKSIHCTKNEYDYTGKWVFNITKGMCFKINPNNSIFSLFLLCSIGNGYGGGDYDGINQDAIGAWYGDVIVIKERTKEDSKFYTECDVIFDEF